MTAGVEALADAAVTADGLAPDGSAARWAEFGVEAPAERRDQVLLELVAPTLSEAMARGAAEAGLFLCELGRRADGRERTTVQVRLAPDAPSALADLAAAVAAGPQPPDTLVLPPEPAVLVPLAGSAMSGPGLAPLTRGLLAEVTPALLAVVTHRRAGRLGAALDLMTAHLSALGPPAVPGADRVAARLGGAPLGFLSFHSHAEAFIASSRDSAATRHAFDTRYEKIRATVTGRVGAVLADPAASPIAAPWYAAVRSGRPAADEAFRTGALSVHDDEDRGDTVGAGTGNAGTADTAQAPVFGSGSFADSAFHNELAAAPDFLSVLRTAPAFLGARLMTSLLYLSLANVGLTLADRYFLCYTVSRACGELFGADPVAVLAELARG